MALKRIVLRDFVIVPALDLVLEPGFSVLTGETGAGKSILIDALQLALGARAEASVVREGAGSTDICVEFDAAPALASWLEEVGMAADESLLLRRVIDAQGRSRAWINGVPASLTQLRAVADHLVDIHGQHAWQSLTRADSARDLLDSYASIDRRELAQTWKQWQQARSALAQALAAQEDMDHQRERLQWQIDELEKLAPLPDEWDEINAQHTRLSHAQALLEAAQTALEFIEDDDRGALRPLLRALGVLRNKEQIESEFGNFAEVLGACEAQLDDVRHSLQSYLRHMDLDPERLASLDARIASWMQLSKKYRQLPQDLPQTLQTWKQELRQLDAAVDLPALEQAREAAAQRYQAAAREVSRQRQAAAPGLSRAITEAMQGLGMQGGRFDVALQALEEPLAAGIDAVEFRVAGHPGVSPKPIAKVASGGELSRLALAIAVTISELGEVDSLIFDEVDSGIGGAVAETVGRLLRELGKRRQVLAVTHLPQVAANADHHLRVSKRRARDSTVSVVQPLDIGQRTQELARMLGGELLSDVTMAHARELLALAARPATPARATATRQGKAAGHAKR